MQTRSLILAVTAGGCLMLPGAATATDLSAQTPVELSVQLGTKEGEFVFTPKDLTLEAGKLYKLILENPSSSKHYFSALRFAAAAWTRKVETSGAEIKGDIREIELKPGGKAEWYLVPVQAGSFDLECTIPGHADAGMTGTITIE